MEIWNPIYWVSGWEDALTAVISAIAAKATPKASQKAYDFLGLYRQANLLLAESDDRFRAFMDKSPLVAWIKNSELINIYSNAQLVKVFGANPLGKRDDEWLPIEVARETMSNDLDVLRSGRSLETIECVPTEEGEMRSWQVTKFLLVTSGEKHVGGCAFDVTPIERLVEELERSNAELEQFAYVVSHDLQQPLRSIAGFSHHLERHLEDGAHLDETSRTYLEKVINASTRMKRLIDDLLAFSRAGKKESVEDVVVDMNQVLAEALENLRADLTVSEAAITADFLPPAAIDKVMAVRVFQNLIGNAIKYRAPERSLSIHVSARGEGDFWCFSVRDNGIGIEEKYYSTIFQVFQRLHGSEIDGTGMGLALVKKIIESYGGEVGVDSIATEGSTFWFTLPSQN
ncbi:MAG: hypothetical protein NVS2B14_10530 [Chamaesiphon sp.]